MRTCYTAIHATLIHLRNRSRISSCEFLTFFTHVPCCYHVPQLNPELLPPERLVLVAVAALQPQLHQHQLRRHLRHLHRHGHEARQDAQRQALGPLLPHNEVAEPRAGLREPLHRPLRGRRRHEPLLAAAPALAEQARQVQPGGHGDDVEGVQRRRGLERQLALRLAVQEAAELGVHAERALEPGVAGELRDGEARRRVRVQQARHEAARRLRHPPRDRVLPAVRPAAHVGDVGVVEGEVAREEDEEDDPAGPRVRLGAVVGPAPEHLGRRERRGAARRVQAPVVADRVRERREAEVGHLEVALGVQQHVLRLHVAVEHPARVAVDERRRQLEEHAPRRVLGEPARRQRRQPGQEVPARGQLHHEVHLGARRQHLVEAEHVGVAQAAHGGHLAQETRRHARGGQPGLVQHLHGHGVASAETARVVYLGEVAPAEEVAELVLAEERGAGLGGRLALGHGARGTKATGRASRLLRLW
uniref:Uncharacterized protein n=1 Tax=Zea mays TaxID=4577 RepID=C4J294_MAIZE|nr:unknown [Zea mays]